MTKELDNYTFQDLHPEKEEPDNKEYLKTGNYVIKNGNLYKKINLADFLRKQMRIGCFLNNGNNHLSFSIKNSHEGEKVLEKIKELGLTYEPE